MLLPFVEGFGLGGGLIVAIGAQNAFVLTQGVRRNHHVLVALLCAMSDALLISLGVFGVGTAVASSPQLAYWMAWGGAAFLLWYGLGSFRSALRGGHLDTEAGQALPLKAVVLTTLAVTYLNPHAYLDTLVLVGGTSGQFEGTGRYLFGAGAVTASFAWFSTLTLGGRMLEPVFTRPAAWRVLDTVVGCTMWAIAAMLVIRNLG